MRLLVAAIAFLWGTFSYAQECVVIEVDGLTREQSQQIINEVPRLSAKPGVLGGSSRWSGTDVKRGQKVIQKGGTLRITINGQSVGAASNDIKGEIQSLLGRPHDVEEQKGATGECIKGCIKANGKARANRQALRVCANNCWDNGCAEQTASQEMSLKAFLKSHGFKNRADFKKWLN